MKKTGTPIEYIVLAMCKLTNITKEELKSRTRIQDVVTTRKLVCWFATKENHKSEDIARELGFNRSNVSYYKKEVEVHLENWDYYKALHKNAISEMIKLKILIEGYENKSAKK